MDWIRNITNGYIIPLYSAAATVTAPYLPRIVEKGNQIASVIEPAKTFVADTAAAHPKVTGVVAGGAIGAVGGVALMSTSAYLIGLKAIGPIAGSWFSANMGAGLTAGSMMATMQSAVMTGSAWFYAAVVGSSVGAASGGMITPNSELAPTDDKPK